MARQYDEDEEFDRQAQEHDLRYVWRCRKCGQENEDPPRVNEAIMCCGQRREKVAETYQ